MWAACAPRCHIPRCASVQTCPARAGAGAGGPTRVRELEGRQDRIPGRQCSEGTRSVDLRACTGRRGDVLGWSRQWRRVCGMIRLLMRATSRCGLTVEVQLQRTGYKVAVSESSETKPQSTGMGRTQLIEYLRVVKRTTGMWANNIVQTRQRDLHLSQPVWEELRCSLMGIRYMYCCI